MSSIRVFGKRLLTGDGVTQDTAGSPPGHPPHAPKRKKKKKK